MRISTGTIFELGVASMQQQTERLLQTQQQVASGRRMLSAADDPVGAARAMDLTQAQAVNRQYQNNSALAADRLALEESTLASIARLVQDVRVIVIQAGNPVLNAADRSSLATEVRDLYQQLLGLANSNDGTGQYLFAGYQSGTRPFSESAPGSVVYHGDQGQPLIQVGPSRQIAAGDSGAEVFQRIRTGNGVFSVTAQPGNTGGAVTDAGLVLDPSRWRGADNNMDFSIRFAVNAGVTSYDIVDNLSDPPQSLLTGLPPAASPYPRSYASGSAIDFSQAGPPAFDFGAQVGISGTPSDGDSFSVRASANQDLFKTLDDLAGLLQAPGSDAVRSNGLVASLHNLDNASENLLGIRVSTGARLRELDLARSTGEDRALQFSASLSRLQDLDYAQAASDLARLQLTLEAAQKSFVQVAGLSLFKFL